MFPFTIRYSRTINVSVTSEQIKELLDFTNQVLHENGANLVLRDYYNKNCLRFNNRVFRFTINWSLMAGVDSGFFKIDETVNNNTKVTYSYTVTTVWIIYSISLIIIIVSTIDTIGLLLWLIGGLFAWFIGFVSHWFFFIKITNDIKGLILNVKK